jgi:hypothetical protein
VLPHHRHQRASDPVPHQVLVECVVEYLDGGRPKRADDQLDAVAQGAVEVEESDGPTWLVCARYRIQVHV